MKNNYFSLLLLAVLLVCSGSVQAQKKKVAIYHDSSVTNYVPATTDAKIISALADYDVTYVDKPGTTPDDVAVFFANYDLILIHSSVGGTEATLLKMRELVGVKPILSLKVFCYANKRWSWSSAAAQNAGAGVISSEVPTDLQNHNIFKNVTFSGTTLTFYSEATTTREGIQFAVDLDGTNLAEHASKSHTIATATNLDGSYTGTHIHEVNLNNAAKYIMLGLSLEGTPSCYTLFNDNAINIIKNSVAYLLDPNAAYDYTTKQPTGIKDQKVSTIKRIGDVVYNPELKEVTIYDITGVAVMKSTDSQIAVNQLPAGLYIAKGDKETIKFVK
ncbi:T9SS type A sorting domain-containing protein [Bacteroides sp. 214]|uniref:T9SS type A sorting domain-containing protein n=1 Tax=Bacteroides sp. 214 TaxID=2302935 RepID=UPI0013D2891B|nr:T9SS type A sorting domain-containing protein [Bacteroides sp. 214]